MSLQQAADEHDEDLQLALALSASEADAGQPYKSTAQGREDPHASSSTAGSGLGAQLGKLAGSFKNLLRPPVKTQQPGPSGRPPQLQPGYGIQGSTGWGGGSAAARAAAAAPDNLASDEALARALQEQFDWEQQAQRQQHGGTAPQLGAAPMPRPPAPAGSPAARPPPLPPGAASSGTCAGCGQPLMSLTAMLGGGVRYMTALGRQWHPGCFRCAACSQPLADGSGSTQFIVGQDDGLPYHAHCHRDMFHPRCQVCSDFVPTQGGGRIVWSETPFWKEKFCPSHGDDGTERCSACTRLQPRGAGWADLGDGRCLCPDCLATLVPDTAECQPLYDDVLRYYVSMGMPLPVRPPMMLVESGALNAAEQSETHGQGRSGPVFHTRGLCLTEEHTTIVSVARVPFGGSGRMGGGLLQGLLPGGYSVAPHTVQLGPSRTEVTAILVLYGLPRLLTGSILAHEVMHAWLRLSGYRGLAPEVEEGLCQLMALLWLEQQTPLKGSFEERLASFFAHQIRTDTSFVYGDGFRASHESFQRFGLQTVLAHVRQTGRLPS